jgi:hypothetical protein
LFLWFIFILNPYFEIKSKWFDLVKPNDPWKMLWIKFISYKFYSFSKIICSKLNLQKVLQMKIQKFSKTCLWIKRKKIIFFPFKNRNLMKTYENKMFLFLKFFRFLSSYILLFYFILSFSKVTILTEKIVISVTFLIILDRISPLMNLLLDRIRRSKISFLPAFNSLN